MSGKKINDTSITTVTELQGGELIPMYSPHVEGGDANIDPANIGSGGNEFDSVDFNPQTSTEQPYQKGRTFYDSEKGSLSGYNEQPDMIISHGEELIAPIVINKTGSIIQDGTPVYLSGTDSGYYTIDLANAMLNAKSRKVYFTTVTIEIDGIGRVTRIGEIGNLDTDGFPVNSLIYLGTTDGTYSLTPPTDGGYLVELGIVKVESATDGILYIDSNSSDLTVEVTDTNGFPSDQRAATTLSFVDATRTFSISPDGDEFHYYELGNKYEKTTTQSVIITDVEGLHVIYFDGETFTSLANPNDGQIDTLIRTKALVAYVYWDYDNQVGIFIADERHGISMAPSTHAYLHFTRGAQYLSGLALNSIIPDESGDLDSDAQFGVDSGYITDEDLLTVIDSVPSTTGLPVYYLDGANGYLRKEINAGFPILTTGTGRMAYNEWTGTVWQVTEVDNNDFALIHVFATNQIDTPVIAIMGQAEYDNAGTARTGAVNELSNLILKLNIQESIPIATVIYQTSNGYINAVKSRIRITDDGDDYISWLGTELSQGASPTDHQNLANLLKAGVGADYGHVDEDLYNEIKSAAKYKGDWAAGTYYPNEWVNDGGFGSIVKDTVESTTERPSPAYNGDSYSTFDGTLVVQSVTAKQLIIGIEESVLVNKEIQAYKVYAIAGQYYTGYYILNPDTNPVLYQIGSFTATSTGERTFPMASIILSAGSVIQLFTTVKVDSAVVAATFQADFNYNGGTSTDIPGNGSIIQYIGSSTSSMKISTTDAGANDVSADLAALTSGDLIKQGNYEWIILSTSNEGTYYDFSVTPLAFGTGGLQTFTFETITADGISYGRDTNYYLNDANLGGLYAIDTGFENLTPIDDAVGIDIISQNISIADDWNILYTPSIVGSIVADSSSENIIANQGVGLLASRPSTGLTIGDIFVATDTNLKYTATSATEWDSGIALIANQFVTDSTQDPDVIYQFDGTTLNPTIEYEAMPYDLGFAISDESSPIEYGDKSEIEIIRAQTIESITVFLNVAPTDLAATMDVKVNGISILTSPIIIPDGGLTTTITTPQIDNTYLVIGDRISCEITQIGATIAGAGAKFEANTTLS